ncbi:MAG: redox protein [Alphaproteobacteria bacterium]|nr:redox protein [Alphaproteobacteria bacterium]
MSAAELRVDARGLLCPWPVLRLCRAAREMVSPGRIRILADDPAAGREIAQLCVERAWKFVPDQSESDVFIVVIG